MPGPLIYRNAPDTNLPNVSSYFNDAANMINNSIKGFTDALGEIDTARRNNLTNDLYRTIAQSYDPNNVQSINDAIKAAALSDQFRYVNNDVWGKVTDDYRRHMYEQLDTENLALAKRRMDAYQTAANIARANANISGTRNANTSAQDYMSANGIRSDAYTAQEVNDLMDSAARRGLMGAQAEGIRARAQRAAQEDALKDNLGRMQEFYMANATGSAAGNQAAANEAIRRFGSPGLLNASFMSWVASGEGNPYPNVGIWRTSATEGNEDYTNPEIDRYLNEVSNQSNTSSSGSTRNTNSSSSRNTTGPVASNNGEYTVRSKNVVSEEPQYPATALFNMVALQNSGLEQGLGNIPNVYNPGPTILTSIPRNNTSGSTVSTSGTPISRTRTSIEDIAPTPQNSFSDAFTMALASGGVPYVTPGSTGTRNVASSNQQLPSTPSGADLSVNSDPVSTGLQQLNLSQNNEAANRQEVAKNALLDTIPDLNNNILAGRDIPASKLSKVANIVQSYAKSTSDKGQSLIGTGTRARVSSVYNALYNPEEIADSSMELVQRRIKDNDGNTQTTLDFSVENIVDNLSKMYNLDEDDKDTVLSLMQYGLDKGLNSVATGMIIQGRMGKSNRSTFGYLPEGAIENDINNVSNWGTPGSASGNAIQYIADTANISSDIDTIVNNINELQKQKQALLKRIESREDGGNFADRADLEAITADLFFNQVSLGKLVNGLSQR